MGDIDFVQSHGLNEPAINLPSDVLDELREILPSDDPFDDPNFNVVEYINAIFPTEQSLVRIDQEVIEVKRKISNLDDAIATALRGESNGVQDGQTALEAAQKEIEQLCLKVVDIREKAHRSEEMVKEITRDIKALDYAKQNLTTSIKTLNNLHMLVDGVNKLESVIDSRQYNEVARMLQAVQNVLDYFRPYHEVAQISQFCQVVKQLEKKAGDQILKDVRDAFVGPNAKHVHHNQRMILDSCKTLDFIDDGHVKTQLIEWFVEQQLVEYKILFSDDQDAAWLDKIQQRFVWIKKRLVNFEERFGNVFPPTWDMSQQIAIEFCRITKEQLMRITQKRSSEIQVKTLLHAIQSSMQFEELMTKRFYEQESPSRFQGIISKAFEPYLEIYIRSQEQNLHELMQKFEQDMQERVTEKRLRPDLDESSSVIPSCGELFVFYRNCLVQTCQLTNGEPLLLLAKLFQKFLTQFALRVFIKFLPKLSASARTSFSNLMQTVQNATLTASNLQTGMQQFVQMLTRDSAADTSVGALSEDEVRVVCTILCSAEYCYETTKQLGGKLKEKMANSEKYGEQVEMTAELDMFHGVIRRCVQLLVNSLEATHELALAEMRRTNWQSIESVGDQSPYVTQIDASFKQTIPLIRNCLDSARKYFTQFCSKYAVTFVQRYVQSLFKCRGVSAVAAEQLRLDAHSLKTVLLDLPNVGCQVSRKPPPNFTQTVLAEMGRVEMLIKAMMAPTQPPQGFVDNLFQLLPQVTVDECQRILEVKALKRNEQAPIVDLVRARIAARPPDAAAPPDRADSRAASAAAALAAITQPEPTGRIKKLEKLIRKIEDRL